MRRVFLRPLPLLAASLLGACTNLAPEYQQPPLPVPAHYAAPSPVDGTPLDSNWRTYFTDASLQALIAQALDHNRDLRIAVSRVAQARAAYGIEVSAQWPTLAVQAAGERSRVPADLNLTRRPLHADQYQVGIGLAAWELDFWGRVRNLSDATLQTYLATDAARSAARASLIGQVVLTYLDLRDTSQRIALAEHTLASRQQTYDMAARRATLGAASQLQLTQVETLLIQARALLLQLQQERDAQQHALALLVGAPVAVPDVSNELTLAAPAAGLPSDLLARRPDIVAAEHRLRGANASIGAARAAFFPRIALTGSLGTASAELEGLFDRGSRAWSFAPSITLPLFDGSRRRDQLNLAQGRHDEALAAYDKAVQGAFRDVADALSALHWLAGQRDVADAAVQVQQRRARLSQLRYDSGASSYLDVLDAQRDLLTAEQQQVRAHHALQAARVALYLALGGAAAETPSSPSDIPGHLS
jgi:multidrug efflux system outer membrane protein